MSNNNDSFIVTIQDHKTVEHHSPKTLLETIELQQIEIQYHCREGYCGACRSKLINGEVEYTTDPLAFIDDDEILPCCCIPTSNITIAIG
ncbi:class I ribonucleotide reductase maintenance protein YfaE [uncultured Paraglaciecola sp.]|mgnify:CR=1 FL=1|uniref:class I ribonucleotide reductase maintenance protein YfaE n=1 Tax=uncultured Paraglaciecola sp. TaxID=1765024 RepID=UPI0030DD9AF1|tara:strand:+ start:28250 stop:28519 length:270 start_codon:yes stop_codon:yes gene_type:complete